MSLNAEIIEQFAPLFICLFGVLPILFIYAFNKKKEEPKPANHNWLIAYLIVLVILSFGVVIMKALELMSIDNSDRSLFVCSILVIACLDQFTSLSPIRVRFQFDLVWLLLYSSVLLCLVPILWQISRHLIPPDIVSQVSIMSTIEIVLMLVMTALFVANGFIKKKKLN